MAIPTLLYNVRRNTPNLLPHQKAEAVRQFELYGQAQAFIEASASPEQYHITTDQ